MQGPGTEGMRHSAFASIIGSERFDTPHLRHEPGGAFAFDGKAVIPSEQRESRDLHCESLLLQPLIDNRWSGKKHAAQAVLATPWSAVGRRDMVQ